MMLQHSFYCKPSIIQQQRQLNPYVCVCVCARILWPRVHVRPSVCTAVQAAAVAVYVCVCLCLCERGEMKETKGSEHRGYPEVVFHCQSDYLPFQKGRENNSTVGVIFFSPTMN